MKTFLKVLLVLLLVAAFCQLSSVLLFPSSVIGGALCAAAAILAGVFAGLLGLAVAAVSLVLLLVFLLAPVWIPVLMLVGFVWLCVKMLRRATA